MLAGVRFQELVRAVLPLSNWWRKRIWENPRLPFAKSQDPAVRAALVAAVKKPGAGGLSGKFPDEVVLTIRVVGVIELLRRGNRLTPENRTDEFWAAVIDAFFSIVDPSIMEGLGKLNPLPLWSVACNRKATRAIWRSRLAIKADAAIRLFDLKCNEIRWAGDRQRHRRSAPRLSAPRRF